MLALHFFQNHGLTHAAVAIQQHARHPGAGGVVIPPLQLLDRHLRPGEPHPTRRLHEVDTRLGILECLLFGRAREVR